MYLIHLNALFLLFKRKHNKHNKSKQKSLENLRLITFLIKKGKDINDDLFFNSIFQNK